MKKTRKFITVAIALWCVTLQAQQVAYKELYDDPTSYKKLSVNLYLFNIDFGTPSFYRVGAGAQFDLNKRLWFMADVEKSIMDIGIYGAKNTECFAAEGGVVFNYRAKIKNGKVQYRWKDSGSEYKFTIPGKVLRTAGFRGGVFMFSGPKDLDFYKVRFNTEGVYAGIVFSATRKKAIDADDISDRHTRKATKGMFYIDALFAAAISYSDNTDYEYDAAHWKDHPKSDRLDTMITKNYIGARMGWMKMVRYPVPLKFGFEVGLRPGLQQNFFFLTKLAISLGFINKEPKKLD